MPISHQKPSIRAEMSKTFRHLDISALVPKCLVDTSAPVP